MAWIPEEERRALEAADDTRQQIAKQAAERTRRAEKDRLHREGQRELAVLQRGTPAARPPWR